MGDISHKMRLYLITDDAARSPDELAAKVAAGIRGGVTAVQFREKTLGPTLCARAFSAVAEVCASAGVPLFLNADLLDRVEITEAVAGIHYSDRNLPLHPEARTHLSGYSAHAVDDAAAAFGHNVDFCTLSPIFPTPSKAGILSPVGTNCISALNERQPGKVIVALGGVDETNAGECIAAGAAGVATIRAVMDAIDPEAGAARLRSIVEKCLAK